ncbi:hypothetical protein CRG98_006171 [Punica granatum]|uniref:Uncharacterized protein n=1 Tax=Punica granatum TaxID=22663 RepID=A0A2I0KY43_PUNGR|nr:hypothetical protein CRG98_006171 [Punica granatum]
MHGAHYPVDCEVHERLLSWFARCRALARRVCKVQGACPAGCKIFSFGSPEQPVKIFALTVQVGLALGGLDTRPPGAPAVPNCLDGVFICPLYFRKVPSWTIEWPPQKGIFDLAGSILLSLEFARAKGSKDSTSECIIFCLRRGVVYAAPLLSGFVDFSRLAAPLGFVSCPVSLFETHRLWMAEAALYVLLGGCTLLKSLDVQGRRLHKCRVIRSIVLVFEFIGGTSSLDTSLVKDDKENNALSDYAGGICGKRYGVVPWEKSLFVPPATHGVPRAGDICFRNLVITTLEWLDRDWGHISIFSQIASSQRRRRRTGGIHSLVGSATVLVPTVAVNAGPEPDAVSTGPEPDAVSTGPESNAVYAGPEPDTGPKPNVVNAGPKPDAESKPKSGAEARCSKCGLDRKVLTWEGGSALGPQLSLPWRKGEGRRWSTCESWHDSPVMRGEDRGWSTCKGWHNSPVVRGGWPGWTASGQSTSRHGEVKTAGGLPAKVGTTRLSCGVGGRDGQPLVRARLAMERLAQLACRAGWVAGMDSLWSEHVSPWRGEDRGWSTREGWHNSPVVRGGWPGWTASGQSTSRHGEVKTAGGLPAKVGTTRLSCGVGGRDGQPLVRARLAMESLWSEHVSPWRGEDRGWSTREGWHNSPVVRGGWPGWTASGQSTSRHGEVKTAGGLPAKVGTTRLSCGVGGRDGQPLVRARLAMER